MCNYHGKWGAHRAAHDHWRGWGQRFEGQWGRNRTDGPPANIRETREGYEIQLAAPGRSREDFRLSVTNDVLTIACTRPEASEGKEQWLRNEFRLAPFERQFQLGGKVDTDLIVARYADGVLEVILPKRPEFSGPAQEIAVA